MKEKIVVIVNYDMLLNWNINVYDIYKNVNKCRNVMTKYMFYI